MFEYDLPQETSHGIQKAKKLTGPSCTGKLKPNPTNDGPQGNLRPCAKEMPNLHNDKNVNDCKDTSGTGRIKTQCLSQTSKGKYILTNNKVTGDKPSMQLFSKQVATQLPLLNKINWTHKSVKVKISKTFKY